MIHLESVNCQPSTVNPLILLLPNRPQNHTITHIAVHSDFSRLNSPLDSAARLIDMEAVVKLTAVQAASHFGEIMGEFLPGNVHKTEFTDTGGMDDAGVEGGKIEHLGERGSM